MTTPPALESFAPRSRPACCGTCSHWTLIRRNRRSRTWCPELRRPLPGDLTACGCTRWRYEGHETQSVQLYQELDREWWKAANEGEH